MTSNTTQPTSKLNVGNKLIANTKQALSEKPERFDMTKTENMSDSKSDLDALNGKFDTLLTTHIKPLRDTVVQVNQEHKDTLATLSQQLDTR